jgi:hypothetical protein
VIDRFSSTLSFDGVITLAVAHAKLLLPVTHLQIAGASLGAMRIAPPDCD